MHSRCEPILLEGVIEVAEKDGGGRTTLSDCF